MDFVTDLVTFNFNLVTFSSPNRDDEFLCLIIIRKCDIDIFVKCTGDTAAHTSVWQQIYGIIEKEHIARHRSSCLDIFNSESIRQYTRTMNLHPIVEDEYSDRSFQIQRAVYKTINRKLNQTAVRYLQLTHTVEFISHLHVMQIASEEIHNGAILVK